MDFHYLSQAPAANTTVREHVLGALKEFHDHKRAIVDAGGHQGKKKALDHFNIPKLELFQSIELSMCANGAVIQWSANITEHAHITEIKWPAQTGNNQNYEEQICQHLDRLDKVCRFELVTSIRLQDTTSPIPWDLDVQDQSFTEMSTDSDVNAA